EQQRGAVAPEVVDDHDDAVGRRRQDRPRFGGVRRRLGRRAGGGRRGGLGQPEVACGVGACGSPRSVLSPTRTRPPPPPPHPPPSGPRGGGSGPPRTARAWPTARPSPTVSCGRSPGPPPTPRVVAGGLPAVTTRVSTNGTQLRWSASAARMSAASRLMVAPAA